MCLTHFRIVNVKCRDFASTFLKLFFSVDWTMDEEEGGRWKKLEDGRRKKDW